MSELYRLKGRGSKTGVELVLTETHLIVAMNDEQLAKIRESFKSGQEAVTKAPAMISWFASKMLSFGEQKLKEMLEPHPLQTVEVLVQHDAVTVKIAGMNYFNDRVEIDPAEGYIFDAKFRGAKAKLAAK